MELKPGGQFGAVPDGRLAGGQVRGATDRRVIWTLSTTTTLPLNSVWEGLIVQ